MGVICTPRGGENDVEWIEDKVCSLQGHLRSLKTVANGGNNGDESGHHKVRPGAQKRLDNRVISCLGTF